VSRRVVTCLPALLVPIALLWVAGSRGVLPSPAVIVATMAVVAVLVVAEGARGLRLTGPVLWLGGLVVWSGVGAALRPVDRVEAARFVATGVVAVALAALAARPRPAAWGRLGVVVGGAVAAAWLVAERWLAGGRPGGPFENPNVAATVIALALALVPLLRWRAAAKVACAGVLLAGLVASGSRAGMLAASAIAAVWALRGSGRRVRLAVAAALLLAGGGLVLRVATDRDPLRWERLRIWAVAWRTAVAELPFGSGPAGYADAAIAHNFPRAGELARYHRLPALAESDALETFAALGVPGVLLSVGVGLSLVRAAASTGAAWAPMAALAVTSAVHTQLPLPAVAWTAAVALAGALPRARGRRLRLPPAVTLAGIAAAAPALAVALGAVPAMRVTAEQLVAPGASALARGERGDAALADAEAGAWSACARRPRWAASWSTLGGVRLQRALARGDGALAEAATDAFAAARTANPTDVWAAYGEGRARRALGDRGAAARALEAAVRLEPHCVPAWVEIGLLRLESGDLATARAALTRAEAALAAARRRPPESAYERALVRVDRLSLQRLRVRCGVRG
jgi:hypothetical protein